VHCQLSVVTGDEGRLGGLDVCVYVFKGNKITLFTKLQKLQTSFTNDSQTTLSCASVTDTLEDAHHGCLSKSNLPV